ncbi:hypothetical protein [Actinoplanes sp. NPDC049681]|uniref:hypothetical protein n=1 Tax=Actinoplanes sp. NPDC049681 TaxID=3363905 RepID=UPI00378E2CDF
MISRVAGATARRRRPILVAGVALALVQAMLTASVRTTVPTLVFAALFVLVNACIPRRRAPAALVVRAGSASFTAPVRAWPVFYALPVLALTGDRVGTAVRDLRADDLFPVDVCVAVVYVTVAVIVVARAWRGFDIALRPDGLYDRRALGTVFVPWAALPAVRTRLRRSPATSVFPPGAFAAHDDDPAGSPDQIRLGYGRPELVRRRGLVWHTRRIRTAQVDMRFLAAAIRFYATNPEQQPAIGTDEGYRRLREAVA